MASLNRNLKWLERSIKTWLADKIFWELSARVEYGRGVRRGRPFNRQEGRTALVEEIFRVCSPALLVETGSNRGNTTVYLARSGLPVRSVEISKRMAKLTELRLLDFPDAEVEQGDSVAFLKKLGQSPERSEATFFYLDAHWGDHLPLAEEVEAIATAFPSAVIMIDDFEVPDDPGYGFDEYHDGRLNLAYLEKTPLASVSTPYFPTLPSSEETPNRRGCVVFAIGETMAKRIEQVTLLRRFDGPWNEGHS